jgi:hypothetical protein
LAAPLHGHVDAAPPDHREPMPRAARTDRREPDKREMVRALSLALQGLKDEGVNPRVPPLREATAPLIDWSFATRPASEFAVNAGKHLFGALIGAAGPKNNERVYGRPNESLAGTLLARATGLSPADRALAAESSRTAAQMLSYTTPPVTGSGLSDAQVFIPYVGRRVFREANRQIEEKKQRRRAAQRLAAGLPPFDPSVPPESWNQLVAYLKETN